jgi:fucose permease
MINRDRNIILAMASIIFIGLGTLIASIGPILPSLAKQANTELAVIGSVFTAVFLGTLLSHLVSGPLGDRIGMGRVVMGGAAMLGAGFLGLSLSHSLPLMLALAFLAGLGLGAADLGGSLWIAGTFPENSVSKLNLLNVFFGVGAFCGPALVSLSLAAFANAFLPVWGAGLVLFLSIPVLYWISTTNRFRPAPKPSAQGNKPRDDAEPVGNAALIWVLGLILLLYVGSESGYGGWVTAYLMQTGSMRTEDAALAASLFWMAIAAGRIIITGIGSRVSALRLLAVSISGAVVASWALVAVSGNVALSFICIGVIGLCFAATYPTVLAVLASAFPKAPGKAAGPATALGSVGGALIPWAQGILLTKVSPIAGMVFVAINVVIIAGLLILTGVLIRRSPSRV